MCGSKPRNNLVEQTHAFTKYLPCIYVTKNKSKTQSKKSPLHPCVESHISRLVIPVFDPPDDTKDLVPLSLRRRKNQKLPVSAVACCSFRTRGITVRSDLQIASTQTSRHQVSVTNPRGGVNIARGGLSSLNELGPCLRTRKQFHIVGTRL